MGQFIYPDSWTELSLVPAARAELIGFLRDVSQWNEKDSHVKRVGADDLIGFFYDTYSVDKGASYLAGGLLFPDEIECFDRFFSEFNRFLTEWEQSHQNLGSFHEAALPTQVTEEAKKVIHKLEQRGVPEWRE
jgi:hypothetical protein